MKIISFLCFVLCFIVSIQCSRNTKKEKIYNYIDKKTIKTDKFKFIYIDTLTFSKYNIFILQSSNGKNYFLFSQKHKAGQLPSLFKKYEEIKNEKIYKLTIKKSDTIPKFHIRNILNSIDYSVHNQEIIANDSLLVSAYTSDNIYTKFVEIIK